MAAGLARCLCAEVCGQRSSTEAHIKGEGEEEGDGGTWRCFRGSLSICMNVEGAVVEEWLCTCLVFLKLPNTRWHLCCQIPHQSVAPATSPVNLRLLLSPLIAVCPFPFLSLAAAFDLYVLSSRGCSWRAARGLLKWGGKPTQTAR